jgi:hypothetical protein
MYKSEHSHMAAGTATVPGSADHHTQRSEENIKARFRANRMQSKRILTNREERAKQYGFVTVECWMNSGVVLTAIIRSPDEDNKEFSGDL